MKLPLPNTSATAGRTVRLAICFRTVDGWKAEGPPRVPAAGVPMGLKVGPIWCGTWSDFR
ncbi:hypothetical protein [Alkalicoccus urumqiensis]|nr:hypothetical protein [Alkalicoccus urumqiensis]